MKLAFFGTPQFAVPSLEALIQQPDLEVAAVITQPDKRRGRGKALSPSPIKTTAIAHELPVFQPRRLKKDAETLNKLRQLQADAFVVVAYGQLLSADILEMPRLGCINAHGSILPAYRGAAPIQWSLVNGEIETGITTMLMDIGMDTGAMLHIGKTPIAWWEHSGDVAERLAAIAADLLVKTLHDLDAGTVDAIAQNDDQATYAPLIQKADYTLDWRKAAIALHNQIRGFFPNSVTTVRDKSLKILKTVPVPPPAALPPDLSSLPDHLPTLPAAAPGTVAPGTVLAIVKHYGPVIATGKGALLLWQVQPSGKKPQSGWDFANGSRLEVGEQLGDRTSAPSDSPN
jgi:methionyl-tRNA formyltransferase